MKAHDLRLGNLLIYDGKAHPILAIDGERKFTNTKTKETLNCSITIGEYDENGFMWTTNGRWLNHFEPIPLTDEWLLKFGFKKGSKANRDKNVFTIDNEISGNRYYFVKYGKQYDWEFGDMTFAQLDFVHQLQNLLFALTGKELNLQK